MADNEVISGYISKVTLPSGYIYEIKDAAARSAIEALSGGDAIVFVGVSSVELTDGGTQTPRVNNANVTPAAGQLFFYGTSEFIWGTDSKWHELGDLSSLGDLAYQDSASGSFTPSGIVSQPTFEGTASTFTGTYTPAGTVSQPTFEGTPGNVSVSGTPTGAISVGSGTTNYTPAGSIPKPTITVVPSTVDKYVAASSTGGGSVTAGSAATCTLPSLSTSVANETLTIGWSAGSFTTNTPTAVTLPSFSSQTIATGISSASSSDLSFNGTAVELKFTGSTLTSSGTFTPAGSVSRPTFEGTAGTVSTSGTPSGTVTQPTFEGTAGTVTVS